MPIYVYRKGQQLGPFDEKVVLSSMRAGQFSSDDLAILQGDSEWKSLGELFPQAQVERPLKFADAPAADPSNARPVYRKTTFQKVFFGMTFVGSLLAMIGAAAYWKLMLGPTGNLEADLGRVAYRDLVLFLAITLFVMTVLTFFAFLLSFKRKIIASNGLRIVMRLFFILLMFIGIVDLAYGGFSYFSFSSTPALSTSNNSQGNELLKALEKGDQIAGPLKGPAIHGPIAAGLILLGLSGVLMTKKSGRSEP
jgi:hypothetical protein